MGVQIKQGFEPPNFTAHFHAWNPDKWSGGLSYEEMKASLNGSGDNSGPALGGESISEALKEFSTDVKFPYEQLKGGDLPESVDLTAKEAYLTEEEFNTVFKMDRAAFNALPKWKQSGHKKKVGLF